MTRPNKPADAKPADAKSYVPDDDELVLYVYGEAVEPEKIRQAIATSDAVRARHDALVGALALVSDADVPEPEADAGRRIWERLAPELEGGARQPVSEPQGRADAEHRRGPSFWSLLGVWLAPPRLAAAGALAAALVVAFLAGRFYEDSPLDGPAPETALSEEVRERILASVVADHLERSERLLVELVNAPRLGPSELTAEKGGAAELVAANRLYRRSSENAGRGDLAHVLDELERLLLDLSHPRDTAGLENTELRERLEDLVFKLRVVSRNLRRPTSPDLIDNTPPPSGTQT